MRYIADVKEIVVSYMKDSDTHWIIKIVSIPVLAVYAVVLFFYLPIYDYQMNKARKKNHAQEETGSETINAVDKEDELEADNTSVIEDDMVDDSGADRKELIEKIVRRVHDLVAESVPDEGEFEEVRVNFEVHDKNLVADRFWLRVFNPPKGAKNWETKRALSIGADKDKSDTSVSMLLESGSKEDILEKLKDPALIKRLIEEIPDLSYHLEDL